MPRKGDTGVKCGRSRTVMADPTVQERLKNANHFTLRVHFGDDNPIWFMVERQIMLLNERVLKPSRTAWSSASLKPMKITGNQTRTWAFG